jgi:hypothetical protein
LSREEAQVTYADAPPLTFVYTVYGYCMLHIYTLLCRGSYTKGFNPIEDNQIHHQGTQEEAHKVILLGTPVKPTALVKKQINVMEKESDHGQDSFMKPIIRPSRKLQD